LEEGLGKKDRAMALTLVIGNKNYSSWSMRPWLMLKAAGLSFEEVNIPLYTGPADKQRILDYARAGKVPILVDGEATIWDSLSIMEYLAERFPKAGVWPQDPAMRAHARSISAEMHSGFLAFRSECSMNIHRPVRAKVLSADAQDNIARVQEIWTDCRKRHGDRGAFLFGGFSAADAMFAPVVHRFLTYAIGVPAPVRTYMTTITAFAPFREWTDAALRETLRIERFEVD
jgi:glutathione S-transferase